MASKLPDRVAKQREEIVERIVEGMEEKGLEWIRGWAGAAAPYNPLSGTRYRGGNRVILSSTASLRGLEDPRWVTFNQARKAGWKLRKGSKSAAVEKWKELSIERERDGEDGEKETERIRVLKCVGYWSVFNASDFDGAPEFVPAGRRTGDDAVAERLVATSRCPVLERGEGRAYYSPARDVIVMPRRSEFVSDASFDSTLLHEMAHSTAHPSALGRDCGSVGDEQAYAREELVAEIASAFAGADIGVDAMADVPEWHFRNHVAYVSSWIGALRRDPDEVFKAAAKASKAADYIVERYRGGEEDGNPQG